MELSIDDIEQWARQNNCTIVADNWWEAAQDRINKYQQLQADYENRLKDEKVNVLKELKREIGIMSDTVVEGRTVTITSWSGMQKRICKLIQSKINSLKED